MGIPIFRWNNSFGERLSKHGVFGPTEDVFGLGIPVDDATRLVHDHHGVQCAVEDGTSLCLACSQTANERVAHGSADQPTDEDQDRQVADPQDAEEIQSAGECLAGLIFDLGPVVIGKPDQSTSRRWSWNCCIKGP